MSLANLVNAFKDRYELEQRRTTQLNAVRSRLKQEAMSFTAGLPSMMDRQAEAIYQTGQGAIRSGLSKTNRAMNRRGLLGSGETEVARERLKGTVVEETRQGIAENNRRLADVAEARRQAYLNYGLENQNQSIANAGDMLRIQEQEMRDRLGGISALGQGLGSVGGFLYGMANNGEDFSAFGRNTPSASNPYPNDVGYQKTSFLNKYQPTNGRVSFDDWQKYGYRQEYPGLIG